MKYSFQDYPKGQTFPGRYTVRLSQTVTDLTWQEYDLRTWMALSPLITGQEATDVATRGMCKQLTIRNTASSAGTYLRIAESDSPGALYNSIDASAPVIELAWHEKDTVGSVWFEVDGDMDVEIEMFFTIVPV